MLNQDFIAILCCPETKSNVVLAGEPLLLKVNDAIRKGLMKNRAGVSVTEPIDGGLLREDGQYLYPIRKDIPVMLIEEALPVKELMS
jgi:uncharacterized protein YbaR (Trm112 family)